MSEILRNWKKGLGLPDTLVIDGHIHIGSWQHAATFRNADEAVEKSALALIQGFSQRLADAIAAAQAAGATPVELQALTDLGTTLKANDDELAAAVSQNTPAQ